MSSKTGGLLSWDWAGVSLLGGVDLLVRGRHRGNWLRGGGGREKENEPEITSTRVEDNDVNPERIQGTTAPTPNCAVLLLVTIYDDRLPAWTGLAYTVCLVVVVDAVGEKRKRGSKRPKICPVR